MRTLLVDDHEIVRRGLLQLLTEEYPTARFGHAATAAEAREQLAGNDWDLVLLDINLPGESGLQLLKETKAMHPSPKVLMLTSHSEDEFAMRSFKLGADGYLCKASIGEEMLLAVKKVLTGGKYVSASLAEMLASELNSELHGEAHESLSTRELDVLVMVARGMTIKEIAAELSLSDKTIATYRLRISRKLKLSTNVELARYALKHGLVD